ncbi:uncharacterized protein DEA37_0010201, partial [Paragonimus westermani]
QALRDNHQEGCRNSSPTKSQTRKSYVETTLRRRVHRVQSTQLPSVRVMTTQLLTRHGTRTYLNPLGLHSYQFWKRKMRCAIVQKNYHGRLDKNGHFEAFLLSKPQNAMDRHNQPSSVLNNSVRSGMTIRKSVVAIQLNKATISLNPVNLMHVPHQMIGKNKKIDHRTHLWASISWPISKDRPISPEHHLRYLPVCGAVVVLLNCSEKPRNAYNMPNTLSPEIAYHGMNTRSPNETVQLNAHIFNLTHAYRLLAGDESTDDVSIAATEYFDPR